MMLSMPCCIQVLEFKSTVSTETATRLVCTLFSYKVCTAPVRFITNLLAVNSFLTPCAVTGKTFRQHRFSIFQETVKETAIARSSSWQADRKHLKVSFVARTGAKRRVVPVEQGDAAQGKFKGVRYRADRKSWVAEMKPFKYKNKVSFGDFKSAMEAARAVDAAFVYYDKNKWRNFRDSHALLPPLPGALTDEAKLKFVKEQARSLAFCALRLESTFDPANRCEELKMITTHPTEPGIDTRVDHVNGAPSNCKDPFEAKFQEELVRSLDAESASLSIQPFEAKSSDSTLDLANINPLTKMLCASTTTILETFPDIPDDDGPWNTIGSEFSEPLDVTDYSGCE